MRHGFYAQYYSCVSYQHWDEWHSRYLRDRAIINVKNADNLLDVGIGDGNGYLRDEDGEPVRDNKGALVIDNNSLDNAWYDSSAWNRSYTNTYSGLKLMANYNDLLPYTLKIGQVAQPSSIEKRHSYHPGWESHWYGGTIAEHLGIYDTCGHSHYNSSSDSYYSCSNTSYWFLYIREYSPALEMRMYDEWSGKYSHMDRVEIVDKLPSITREDGWYKGFFTRYLEVAPSMIPYVESITVELESMDENGKVSTRTVKVPRAAIYGNTQAHSMEAGNNPRMRSNFAFYSAAAPGEGIEVDENGRPVIMPTVSETYNKAGAGKVFFHYDNMAEDLSELTATASNAKLAGDDIDEVMANDPFNDSIVAATNVIEVKKNEYPVKVTFTAVNIPGNGDNASEFNGVQREDNGAAPDFYIWGNIDDIITDEIGPEDSIWKRYDSNRNLSSPWSYDQIQQERSNDIMDLLDGLYSGPSRVNRVEAKFYKTSYNKMISKTLPDPEEFTRRNFWGFDDSSKDPSYQAGAPIVKEGRSYWWAKSVQPSALVNVDTMDDPEQKRAYDFEGDNKTPMGLRYRIWAQNTTKKQPKYLQDQDGSIKTDEEGNPIPNPEYENTVFYKEMNYSGDFPDGYRLEKIWIPAQFIDKDVYDDYSFEADRLELTLGKLEKIQDGDGTSVGNKREYKIVPDPTNKVDLLKVKEGNEERTGVDRFEYGKYMHLVPTMAEANVAKEQDGGEMMRFAEEDDVYAHKYYVIDLEKMFFDGVLTPVEMPYTQPESGEEFIYLQNYAASYRYHVQVKSKWLVDYEKNKTRYFQPDSTLTGKLSFDENGKEITPKEELPIDLMMEGVFVDKRKDEKYRKATDSNAQMEETWENRMPWTSTYNSLPSIDTDQFTLKKEKAIKTNVSLTVTAAGINPLNLTYTKNPQQQASGEGSEYRTKELTVGDSGVLDFYNRATKLEIAVNRLPYKGAEGQETDPNADGKDPKNRPMTGDYNKQDDPENFEYDPKNPDYQVNIRNLIPGDRFNYFITVINEKDPERATCSWNQPAIRFEAPEGTRIARWVYLPEGSYAMGEAEGYTVDAEPIYKEDSEEEPQMVYRGYQVPYINGAKVTYEKEENPVVEEPEGSITIPEEEVQLTAYDPTTRKTDEEGNVTFKRVPHDTELADLTSESNKKAPISKPPFMRSAPAFEPAQEEEVTKTMVWRFDNAVIPINQGVRIMVVLEVEDDFQKADGTKDDHQGKTIEPSNVYIGALPTHGYEPFYFSTDDRTGESSVITFDDEADRIKEIVEEVHKTESTVQYHAVKDGINLTEESDVDRKTTQAWVKAEGAKTYKLEIPIKSSMYMENNTDGSGAVLTVGQPYVAGETYYNVDEATNGMIRNDVRHAVDELDVIADYIGNNYDYNGKSTAADRTQVTGDDALDQQGFFMDYIPKVMYATNSNAEKDQEARYFVQLREELRGHLSYDGTDQDDWTKSYDQFWVEVDNRGYRLTDLDEDGNPLEDKEPIAPYEIARFKWRYSDLAAYGAPQGDNKETYLTMEPVEIKGIAKFADNNQKHSASSYQYTRTLAVGITGHWRHDHLSIEEGRETDSYHYQISSKSELTVRRRLPQVVLDSQAFERQQFAERKYKITGINDLVDGSNAKSAADIKAFVQSGESGAKMPDNETLIMKGYRPGQKIWNKITLLALNRKEQKSTDAAAVDDPYVSLGTGELYSPTIVDKVPASYVIMPGTMGINVSDDPENPTEVELPADFEIKWYHADGTLKDENDPTWAKPKVTVYKVVERDIGGSFTIANRYLNKAYGAGANGRVSMTADVSTDPAVYFVYTYTFNNAGEDKENTAALLPGEQIELIYPTEAKLNGLPRVKVEELAGSNNNAYLPSFGQYGYTSFTNLENVAYPSVKDTKDRMMDMDNLIHDVAATGQREGGRVHSYTGKIYHDDMRIKRSEFLGDSQIFMPGEPANNRNAADGSSGSSGSAWDCDMDSARRQRVTMKSSETYGLSGVSNYNNGLAALQSNREFDKKAGRPKLLYGNYSGNFLVCRDYHLDVLRTRTFDSIEHWNHGLTEQNREENLIWSSNSLHLQKAWLYGASQFFTSTFYNGKKLDRNVYSGIQTVPLANYDLELTDQAAGTANSAFAVMNAPTRSIQFGETYNARLYAANYGDWDLDGVVFTYVLPRGVMPLLGNAGSRYTENGLDKSVIGVHIGGTSIESKEGELLDPDQFEVKILQSPNEQLITGGVEKATGHLAAKSAMDPQMAAEFYASMTYTYSSNDSMTPWVVEVTVKNPLTKWWNRGEKESYQMYVDLPCVVYGQNDTDLYHDTLYVAPYTPADRDPDSAIASNNEDYYQIYDRNHWRGDIIRMGAYDQLHYQDAGMDQIKLAGGNRYYRPQFYSPNVTSHDYRNQLCGVYYDGSGTGMDGRELFVNPYLTKTEAVSYTPSDAKAARKYAVSGTEAMVKIPTIRHWSEVDGDENSSLHNKYGESKFDEFYQSLEDGSFKISMFAENQFVWENMQAKDYGIHYRYGDEAFMANVPRLDDAGMPYATGYGNYSLPVLTDLLPYGIVPVDAYGVPYPRNGRSSDGNLLNFNSEEVKRRGISFELDVTDVISEEPSRDGKLSAVTKDKYHAEIDFIETDENGNAVNRYLVKFVPNAKVYTSMDINGLKYAFNYTDMWNIITAPALKWNDRLNIRFDAIAVDMPEAVNKDGDVVDAYLERWQQNRSFSGSKLPEYKFRTDADIDRFYGYNPYDVGKESMKYSQINWTCPSDGRKHELFDTRLDSTGMNGRIKDPSLIGQMKAEAELENGMTAHAKVEDYPDRTELNVGYDRLDVNGNGITYALEDGKKVEDRFVSNVMQIRTRNPRITLDKRLQADPKGLLPENYIGGDGDESPDYHGYDIHDHASYRGGDHAFGDEECGFDFEENTDPDTILKELDEDHRIVFGSRLWYQVKVKNEASASVWDESYGRLEKQVPAEVGYKQNNAADQQKLEADYERYLMMRSQKLSESGNVAHGAFVFSDYLPSVLAYDRAIMIETADGTLLTKEEAETAGWTIIDNTEPIPEEGPDLARFVSITVIPPSTLESAADQQQAYKEIMDGKHPAGYLAADDNFSLKIRTRVADIPDTDEEYDKDGYSKETYYNKVFVNLDCLDGDYSEILDDDQFTDYQFGGQSKDSVRYYSGEDTNRYVMTPDGVTVAKDSTMQDGTQIKGSEAPRLNKHKDNWNQKKKAEGEIERYAYDSAFGFKVTEPGAFSRINTDEPVILLSSGSITVPDYKALTPVNLYIDEARLDSGNMAAVYLLNDLPLYSVINKSEMYNDLDKDYPGAIKVLNTVKKVSTGKWYIPEDVCLVYDEKEKPEFVASASNAYRNDLLDHLKVTVYYSSREKTDEQRIVIDEDFDIDETYEDGSRVWNKLVESGVEENKVYEITDMEVAQDMNQMLWSVTSDDPVHYPVPQGFKLDIDADPNEDGTAKEKAEDKKNMSDMKAVLNEDGDNTNPNTQSPHHISPYKEGIDDVYENGILISLNSNTPDSGAISYSAHYHKLYGQFDDIGRKAMEERKRAGFRMVQKLPILEIYIGHSYFRNIKDLGVEEHYEWDDTTNLFTNLNTGRTMKFNIRLDNMDQDQINSKFDKEDVMDKPTVTATIPSIFTINELDYLDFSLRESSVLSDTYKNKYDYSSDRTLLWTYHVESLDGGEPNKETTIKLRTEDPKDSVKFGKSLASGERFVRFEFDGQLMPGDRIVIEYMGRITATNETKDPTRTTITSIYGTNAYGTLKKNPPEGDEDIPYNTAPDQYDYDEDNSTQDNMIIVRSGEITFEPQQETAGSKLVNSMLHVEGGSVTYPVPVLEGEQYSYRNEILNRKPYTEDDKNSYDNPVIFDLLPLVGDEKIEAVDNKAVARNSMWRPRSLLNEDSFKLYSQLGRNNEPVDPDLYTVYLGPVSRGADGSVTGAGVYEDAEDGLISSPVYRSSTKYYEVMRKRFRGEAVDASLIQEVPAYNYEWQDYYATVDEIRTIQEQDPDLADEILRGLRYFAVNFNHDYEMKGQTKFTMKYDQRAPLNLPVYYGTLPTSMKEETARNTIRNYAAINTFMRYWEKLNPAESNEAVVYVNAPEGRGYIGDYIWLDDNSDGLQNEIEYEIPTENRNLRTRKIPKRTYDPDTESYVPDWGTDEAGNLKPDPGVNHVLVQLLTPGGHLSNMDGQAVKAEPELDDVTGLMLYTVLDDETGEPKTDFEGLVEKSLYGPVSFESESDYYGNQGYYILTNLKPGEYRVRFTIPDEYKDYGLSTPVVRGSQMKVYTEGETVYENEKEVTVTGLVFETEKPFAVEAAVKERDDLYVSCDIGLGKPVRYGGTVWMDEYSDESNKSYDETNGDSIYQKENPKEPHVKKDEVTITAYIKGEVDGFGNPVPARDMRGKIMQVTTDDNGDYRFDYMWPSHLKEDGTYDREYFFKVTDKKNSSWKPTYMTYSTVPTSDDDKNDLNADGTTNSFPALFPTDPDTGERKMVTDPDDPFYNLYEADTTVDLGLRSGASNIISGLVWEDKNRNGLYDNTVEGEESEPGVGGVEVYMVPYIWMPEGEETEGKGSWQRVAKIPEEEKDGYADWERIAIATDSNAEMTERVFTTKTTESGQYLFRNLPVEAAIKNEDGSNQTYLMGYRIVVPDLPKQYTITPPHNYPMVREMRQSYRVSDLDKDAMMHSFEDKREGVNETYYVLASLVDPNDEEEHPNTRTIGKLVDGELVALTYDTDTINPQDNVDGGIVVYSKANISGMVWDDVSEDNLRQADEKGVEGVKVILQYCLTATGSNAELNDSYLVEEDGIYSSIFAYRSEDFDVEAYAKQHGLTKETDYWYDANYVVPMSKEAEAEFEEIALDDKLRRQELVNAALEKRHEAKEIEAASANEFNALKEAIQRRDDLETEVAGLIQKGIDLTVEYDGLALKQDSIKMQIDRNNKQLTDKRKEITDFNDANSELILEFDSWKEARQKAEDDLKVNRTEISDREEKLEAWQKELETAADSVQTLKDRIQEIEKRLEEIAETPDDTDLAEEKAELETEKAGLEADLSDLETEIQETELEMKAAQRQIEALESENLTLQDTIDEITQKIGEKQPEIERLEALLDKMSKELEDLEQEASQLKAENSSLSSRMALITLDKVNSKKQLDADQQELNRVEARVVAQQIVVDKINRQIDEKLKQAEELEASADIWFFAYVMCFTGEDGRYSFDKIPLFDELKAANPLRNPDKEEIIPYTFRIVTEKAINMEYVKANSGDDDLMDSDVGFIANASGDSVDTERQETLAGKYGAVRENVAVSSGFTLLMPEKDWYSHYDGVYGLFKDYFDTTHDVGLRVYDWYSQLGGTIWRDENHDGIHDQTEKGIANVPVSLYRYGRFEEGSEPVYYTYEILEEENIASASNATASNAEEKSSLIRITGKKKVSFGWSKVEDVTGKSVAYTDEDGEYRFKVPVTDPDNPVEPYLYKVSVDKGEGEQEWSPFTHGQVEDEVSNDVIPSNHLLNLRADSETMQEIIESSGVPVDEDGFIREGSILVVPGIYDPAAFKDYVPKETIQPSVEDMPKLLSLITPEDELEGEACTEGIGNACVCAVGNSIGMEAEREQIAISHVFNLLGTAKRLNSRYVDLSTKRDDLHRNGGIMMEIIPQEDPVPPEDPVKPEPEGPKHHGGSDTVKKVKEAIQVHMVEPLIITVDRLFNPKMGYTDYTWVALAAIALALLALYISRKKKK